MNGVVFGKSGWGGDQRREERTSVRTCERDYFP